MLLRKYKFRVQSWSNTAKPSTSGRFTSAGEVYMPPVSGYGDPEHNQAVHDQELTFFTLHCCGQRRGISKPTFPIYHPNSWKSYHFPTAKGTVSPMQPSDGMILVIGPRLEGHSVIFLAIQTHLSCRFLLAVDSLGLRRSGSSSQIINQAQDFPEQVPRHRHLSQLERNVAAMSGQPWPRSSPACRATSSSTSAPPPSAKPVSS